MIRFFEPLFAPQNSATIGAWGFIIGALSGLLGIGGFGITLYQVWKIKAATEASKDAISSLKVRLSHLDLIQECAKAESFAFYKKTSYELKLRSSAHHI